MNKFTLFFTIVFITAIDIFPIPADSSANASIPLNYTFKALPAGKHTFRLRSSGYAGKDAAYVTGPNGSEKIIKMDSFRMVMPGVTYTYSGSVDFSFGLLSSTDISLLFPIYTDVIGSAGTFRSIGDLIITAQYSLISTPLPKWFHLASRLALITPTGTPQYRLYPRHVYSIKTTAIDHDMLTEGQFYLHPSLLSTVDFHRFLPIPSLSFHFNAGVVFTTIKECTALTTALALTFQPVSRFSFSAEFSSETRTFMPGQSIFKTFHTDILRFTPSARVHLPFNLTFGLSGDFGLSDGNAMYRSIWHKAGYVYATKALPLYGASVSLAWDISLKRIFQRMSRPSDSSVPEIPGDTDRDSIPDSLDACKKTPEDYDNFEDTDGCPDLDNDNDGIVDEIDGCPDNPEDTDAFEDKDGCPDYDNDSDQVADTVDACPDQAGPENSRGCPVDGTLLFSRTVLEGIVFKTGTSKITAGHEILDQIVKAMNKLPKSTIEIQVHTDNQESFKASAELSQRRADVLKLYIVAKGIRPDRVKAIGLGSEFPITDNSTAEGRAKNRRVELRRID